MNKDIDWDELFSETPAGQCNQTVSDQGKMLEDIARKESAQSDISDMLQGASVDDVVNKLISMVEVQIGETGEMTNVELVMHVSVPIGDVNGNELVNALNRIRTALNTMSIQEPYLAGIGIYDGEK